MTEIGYARVSTDDQRLDLQLAALRRAGVVDADIYVEKVSGASKRRPELDLCLKALRPGDTLVVWKLDRIARSIREFYKRVDQVAARGARFRSLTEQFQFDEASGRFILGILALVAEFERSLTSQRTKAGIEAARAQGWSPGRKVRFTPAMQAKAKADLRRGMPVKEVAAKYKVSTSLLHQRGLKRRWK